MPANQTPQLNNNWVMVDKNNVQSSTPSNANNKLKNHTKKRANVHVRIANSGRTSRRNTNNILARQWRNKFNDRVDRLVMKIERLKKEKISPENYAARNSALDTFLTQLERIQDNIETYNIKNQPVLKQTWSEFLDNMDVNIELLKAIK